jgi:hypothetical protein
MHGLVFCFLVWFVLGFGLFLFQVFRLPLIIDLETCVNKFLQQKFGLDFHLIYMCHLSSFSKFF